MSTDLVERLHAAIPYYRNPLMREAADEIERLREREAELQAQCGYTESIQTLEIERLRAAFERMRVALEIIAGRRQCLDNLMGNGDVAVEALDGKR